MGSMPALVDQLSNFCWAFRELVVTASFAASMAASGGLGARSPSSPRPHSSQDSGMIPAIASFETPNVSRISRKLPPSWAMMLVSGSPVLTRSPNGPVRSARTSGRIPTLLPMEADIRLATVNGSPNPPAPVERRAWA